jgi:ribose transport system ATP-binding protein
MPFEVRGLVKTYGGVPVLRSVDLAVDDGEIHALLGANGAGKSTLIKCIGGAIKPDIGEIDLGGTVHLALSPREARDAGVAIIYQDFSLAPSLTVTENIFLGEELRRGPFLRRAAQSAEALSLVERLGADIDPDATLADLPGASLQIVEILKAIRRNPKLLILDEPTASLTESEVRVLSDHLRTLKERRLPILYVTHRLNEVFALADQVTVLRGGSVVLSARVADVSRADLVEAIVGASVLSQHATTGPAELTEARPVLAARGLVAPGVGPLDFEVYPGEVLGIFGLLGSGRTELLETLAGAQRPSRGTILIDGRERRFGDAAEAIAAGVALVPSERLRKSIFPTLTGADNLLLPTLRALARGPFRRRQNEQQAFSRLAGQLSLQPPKPEMRANRFSGGNQQKLSLGRWLWARQRLRVFLLDEPTQGVDVGGRADLYEAIRTTAAAGECAALVTSSEPEELVLLADRVFVLVRGRIVGQLRGEEIAERPLLELAHHGE